MSLKDNFNQAVKEILKSGGLIGEDLSRESKKKTDIDRYIDPPKADEAAEVQTPAAMSVESVVQAAAAAVPKPAEHAAPEQSQSVNPFAQSNAQQTASVTETRQQYEERSAADRTGAFTPQSRGGYGGGASQVPPVSGAGNAFASQGRGGYGGGTPPVPPNSGSGNAFTGKSHDSPYYETEETTIISRNTIVNGSIRSFANVNIDGSVEGDVKITKNISVTGKIVGDIECNNSVMAGASMQGNMASKGQVQVDRDTIILGDISAQYLDLNGKIKGNLDIGGKAEFKTDAVIIGNITASTITVLDGATIQGYVNTTFLQESSSNIFPDAIAVTE